MDEPRPHPGPLSGPATCYRLSGRSRPAASPRWRASPTLSTSGASRPLAAVNGRPPRSGDSWYMLTGMYDLTLLQNAQVVGLFRARRSGRGNLMTWSPRVAP
ncbi:protein of unknown function (plasmid) [Azospirillum baldaniorum]|uniref:Uncharacterized protein n=1 Tax=Azospirillum baldaniorum TaxID=1064539 RepID=A0A9P1NQG9_9PROT|nr:protein of unknown function [Azospirillum baldaniorum]